MIIKDIKSKDKGYASLMSISGSAKGMAPDEYFVVSRDSSGKPLSFFKDMTWDWTPYDSRGRSRKLNFKFWNLEKKDSLKLTLVAEIKWIMFLAIWRRTGLMLSPQTLHHYIKLLRKLARFSYDNEKKLVDVITNRDAILEFVLSEKNKTAKDVSAILSMLAALGAEQVGYSVPGIRIKTELRAIASKYAENIKQHPPIPTRIYSHIITTLLEDIDAFENISDKYFQLIMECQSSPLVGRGYVTQCSISKKLGIERPRNTPDFQTLLKRYGLKKYFEEKGLQKTVRGLSNGIYEIQTTIKLVICLFTGMRAEEVSDLPLQCLDVKLHNEKKSYIVYGTTTKLNNGEEKETRWVTCSDAARGIELAQNIARFTVSSMKVQSVSESEIPLMVSSYYLGLGSPRSSRGSKVLLSSKLDLKKASKLRARLQIPIADEDLLELEQIDLHRAWRAESQFVVGSPWILTSHQFRRSLALYAQRSGFVSLPSLKRQLQHITEDMSRYYARGSQFARNFIGDNKDHFGYEWQETQPISSALGYILKVLMTDDVLFGGHANWVDMRMTDDDGVIVIDRKRTIEKFKRGELAYKETSLGGCVNPKNCDKVALRWLNIDCISGCKNLVGRLTKLDCVISAQENLVLSLDTDSIEYRAEKHDLDVLVATRMRVVEKKSFKEIS